MPKRPSDGRLLWMVKGLRNNVAHQSQAACDQNRQRSVDQRFNLSPDFDSSYETLQQPRKQPRFQDERQHGSDIYMTGMVEVRDDPRDPR